MRRVREFKNLFEYVRESPSGAGRRASAGPVGSFWTASAGTFDRNRRMRAAVRRHKHRTHSDPVGCGENQNHACCAAQ